jgi:hypothetical protein
LRKSVRGSRRGCSSAASIPMMQATHHGLGDDPATLRRFHRTRHRSIVAQTPMRPRMVIIIQIRGYNSSQMTLIQDDDMVQTLAAERANKAFAIRILPGRTRCRDHFLYPQARQAATRLVAEYTVAIPDQITRRRLEGEGLPQLLTNPRSGRRRRNVEVNDPPAFMAENDEDVEQAKRNRGNDEEVHRGQCAGVVFQESTPSLRGGWRWRTRRMYLATVASATSWPKRRSSAWMRGAPQVGLSRAMRRMSVWMSRASGGRPTAFARDFQRQYMRKPCWCQRMTVCG